MFGIVLAFQNCQKVGFSKVESFNSTTDVICDPFNNTTADSCPAGSGLIGNIYYRPTDATWNVNSVHDLIQKGTKVQEVLQLSQLDIPERSFSSGFPVPSGGLVQNDVNQDLIEWFAIDMMGYIQISDSSMTGEYQFGIASDDGVIFQLDGLDVVKNDTVHSTTWNCASQPVFLMPGVRSDVSLKYFQGPRYHITLQLMWRPWSKHNLPCNSSGDWQPVPSSIIFHD